MVKPVWTADIEIDLARAANLIAGQFSDLRVACIEPFGLGWDNAAYLVNGSLVFRFPRRRIAVRLIEREIALLPLIAPHLPAQIPAPRYIGSAGAGFPWPFAGYPRIPGVTACSLDLRDEERGALAQPLARFLRALHAIDPAALVAAGLPPDEIGRLDHAKRMRLVHERAPSVAGSGVAGLADVLNWLQTHPPGLPRAAQLRVVHGDFYARHVLLDDASRLTGVIDWGDLHWGDPALDIAIAHLMLPAHAHAAFRAAYGPIDARTWMAARFRALYHAVIEIDYGMKENDVGMRDIGATALRLMRDALE